MIRPAFPTPAHGPWETAPPPVHALRRLLARRLRRAGAWLRHAARWLATPARRPAPHPQTLPRLEFHAEAGAPEGALYIDGEYIGRLDVTRL